MAVTKGTKSAKAEKKQRGKKQVECEDVAGGSGGSGARLKDKGGCCGDETDVCVNCGKDVLDSQQGLKCDGCGFWHHINCEGISEEIYDFLFDHRQESSLLWYCRKCIITSRKMTAMMVALQDQQQHLEDKVNELVSSVKQQIEDLGKRFDEHEVVGSDVAQVVQKRVEEKMDKIVETMETMEKHKKDESHLVHDCVEDAVRLKLQEDREEVEEIQKRKTSVIIHGLAESADTESEKRRKYDEDVIIDMLHEIGGDKITVNNAIRLGKRSEIPSAKPRPIKLVVASEEQKDTILRLAKNLRSRKEKGLDRVFIHQDMTPKQRQQRMELVKQMKDRQQTTGEKNLIIVNGKIVVRKPRDTQVTSN